MVAINSQFSNLINDPYITWLSDFEPLVVFSIRAVFNTKQQKLDLDFVALYDIVQLLCEF